MKLAPIADRIAKSLPAHIQAAAGWEELLQEEINMAHYGELNWTQSGLVFDMVVARWNKEKRI